MKCVEMISGTCEYGKVSFIGKISRNRKQITKNRLFKKFLENRDLDILNTYESERNGITYITFIHNGRFDVGVRAFNSTDNFIISELLKLGGKIVIM